MKKESGIRIQRFRGPEDTVGGRVAATTIKSTGNASSREHIDVVTQTIPGHFGDKRHYATIVTIVPEIDASGELPESNPDIILFSDSGTNKRDAGKNHTKITNKVDRALVAII